MKIDLGKTGLLEFCGPDAVRFLNGQITQDVRKVLGTGESLPSCVIDAKGKLQFRIWLTEGDSPGAVWVLCEESQTEELELRLTRYLIADDVEVKDRSGEFFISHLAEKPETGGLIRASKRLDFKGWDVFSGEPLTDAMDAGELERYRIENGIPRWGVELKEGMLPPEAGLDITDISYNKGCYIGQEVISRIKSAGKVNRRLVQFEFTEDVAEGGELLDDEGKVCGEVTSVSGSYGLGFIKRGKENSESYFLHGTPAEILL
ncbi:YgfZ/GcvT domain-containing protein [Luteolibacter algae]|uniref:YgfZ/GcvT domain-containing protein n=1 Tax=Luteolibacter algae TaxID=454151 RepID=A0ABW5D9S3_9BACT